MSQRAALAAMDARLHAALADAGLADTGTYTAPGVGATPVPCRAYIDKSLHSTGEYAPTFGPQVTASILRADVAAPAVGGTLAIDGETFVIDAPDESRSDDGISVWVVRHV